MSRYESKAARSAENEDASRDPRACHAWGCPLPGSTSDTVGGGGAFYCHCHFGTNLDRWGEITRAIRDHAWLLDLMRDVTNDHGGKLWRDLATQFWADSDAHMVPSPGETRALYAYRLLLELECRVGVRARRPAPMLPQSGDVRHKPGNVRVQTAEPSPA